MRIYNKKGFVWGIFWLVLGVTALLLISIWFMIAIATHIYYDSKL